MNTASEIPTEILGEIFLHAIDGPISNIQDNNFPWTLDRVCKSWRFAFVTYSYLWSWITINLAESYFCGPDLNAVNQCLALCLERSGNYPLNISIHLSTNAYDGNSPSFTLVWKTFLSSSHRWRTVHLENIPELQFITLDSCRGKTPILESLTIHNHKDVIGYNGCTAFQVAPHLTRFTLRDEAAMFAIQRWSVPWMQLTTLMLRFDMIACVDQLYFLFKELRDIQELRLIFEGDEFEPGIDISHFIQNSRTPQCLQHLRVLQICCVGIFSLITAPSLSELCLDVSVSFYPPDRGIPYESDSYDVPSEEILSSFIQRSSCKLQKLTLTDFLPHLSRPLVQSSPDVVELCLADVLPICITYYLLLPNQFPRLRVLDCTICTTWREPEDFIQALRKILKLRNGSSAECSVAPLKKVIFRPALKDGEASVLVTTTNWKQFRRYVLSGVCCEFILNMW